MVREGMVVCYAVGPFLYFVAHYLHTHWLKCYLRIQDDFSVTLTMNYNLRDIWWTSKILKMQVRLIHIMFCKHIRWSTGIRLDALIGW